MAAGKVWKPLELARVTAEYLASKQVSNPRLDAELLLLEAMGLKRRVDLYAGFEREISGKELDAYRELIRRRADREPVSRILERREFMGISFRITPDVLSPRPETELLVETALAAARPGDSGIYSGRDAAALPAALSEEMGKLLDDYGADIGEDELREAALTEPIRQDDSAAVPPVPSDSRTARETADRRRRPPPGDGLAFLDLGTGSGCVAVALAAFLPGASVVAVDASAKALAVARKNAASAGVAERVEFRRGDWFGGCRPGETFDFILSNPPYLTEGDPDIWPEVARHDPPAALYGGRDGLDCYRRIIPDSLDRLRAGGRIFFEVGTGQAAAVTRYLENAGYAGTAVVRDHGGVERVVAGTAPAGG